MKEIIVYSTNSLTYKVVILDNSISFIEEYSSDSDIKQSSQTNHFNVPIKDVQNIKYKNAEETIKSQMNPLPFILSGILILGAIVLFSLKFWAWGGVSSFAALIALVVGISMKKPETSSASQSLIIEGESKVLYQKRVNLSNDKLFEIISSIREKQ